jgi:hypothetical protein
VVEALEHLAAHRTVKRDKLRKSGGQPLEEGEPEGDRKVKERERSGTNPFSGRTKAHDIFYDIQEICVAVLQRAKSGRCGRRSTARNMKQARCQSTSLYNFRHPRGGQGPICKGH